MLPEPAPITEAIKQMRSFTLCCRSAINAALVKDQQSPRQARQKIFAPDMPAVGYLPTCCLEGTVRAYSRD
jgi:hypothetical protein